ncbi:DUF6049 family protein [Actinomyces sp. oral taxon 181]|uniref:DUF6049 family protein n=1 Tax=Actinomyces sp. oral taxon 181 TaxID=712121 RepID=UPI0025C3205B|nr:DUF6049 family protein [Actinomyces sp. oral taxon 181]MBS5750372.1 hypothetical protein [Actinomyces sp. oral taxon 181]
MIKPPAARYALTLLPLSALLLGATPASAQALPTHIQGTQRAQASASAPSASLLGLAPQSTTRPQILGDAGQASGIDVRINRLEPRVITSQHNLQVSGVVRNLSDKPVTNPSLDAYVQTYSPVTAPELSSYLSGQSWQGRRVHAGTLEATIAPHTEQTFHITIPFESLPFGSDFEWGPRGITIVVEGDETRGSDRSILVWDSGYSLEPTRANVLLPWTESTPQTPTDSYSILSAASMTGVTFATDSDTLLRELTVPEDQSSSRAFPSVSPSAASPSTSSSSEASASPSASSSPTVRSEAEITADRNTRAAFIQTFFERTKELVALPSHDADLSLATTLNNDAVMDYLASSRASVPTSVSKVKALLPSSRSKASTSPSSSASSSNASPTSESSQSPSATASPDSSSASSDKDNSGPTLISNVSWPASQSWGTQALNSKYASTVIAPPGQLAPSSEQNFTSMAKVKLSSDGQTHTGDSAQPGDTVTALASIDNLSELLSWDAQSVDDELDTQQFLTALTAMITRERPNFSRTLFVPLQRGSSLDENRVERVRAILDNRWVKGTSFSELVDSEATDIERNPVEDAHFSDSLRSQTAGLSGAYSNALPLADATENVDAARLQLNSAVASALQADAGDQQSQTITANTQALDAFRSSVSVESSNAVNLINKSANFPVRVRNSLPWPVNVKVTLLPSDPRLRVTSTGTATIPANSSSNVDVPVTAIGSGDIRVTYKVSTPSGAVLDDSQKVLVRMRAGWEDAATAVVTVIVGIAFLGGIIRTIRRRLKSSQTEESSHLPGVGGVEKGTVNVPLSSGGFVHAGRPPRRPDHPESSDSPKPDVEDQNE